MEHLHVWFVTAAYAVTAVILLADAILPRIKFKSLLRGILLRERRGAGTRPRAGATAGDTASTDPAERATR